MATDFSFKLNDTSKGFHDDYLIDGLWILEKSSGLCIFEKMYEDVIKSDVTEDLVCSFFSAFLKITKETFDEDIQYIKLFNKKLYFEFSDTLVFVLAVRGDKLTDSQVKDVIHKISFQFNKLFHDIFKNWNSDISQFRCFSKDLDSIVKVLPFYMCFN